MKQKKVSYILLQHPDDCCVVPPTIVVSKMLRSSPQQHPDVLLCRPPNPLIVVSKMLRPLKIKLKPSKNDDKGPQAKRR